MGELLAFHEFENQEPLALGLIKAVNGGDIRMVERSEDLSLALETRDTLLISREARGEDLDRDLSAQLRVARAKHLAHSARAERRKNLVRTEACSRSQHPAFGIYFLFFAVARRLLHPGPHVLL